MEADVSREWSLASHHGHFVKKLTFIHRRPYARIIKFDDPTPTTTWYINPATNILQANKTSTYATTSTFIVCGPHYFLYLQTGSDIPPDGSCFTTQLQLSRINGPVFG